MTGTTGELEEFVVSVVRAMAKALKGCSISQGVLTKQWLELNWLTPQGGRWIVQGKGPIWGRTGREVACGEISRTSTG